MRPYLPCILHVCLASSLVAAPIAAQARGPLIIRPGASQNSRERPFHLPPRLMSAMHLFGFQFLQEGQRAMDFTLKDLAGGEFHMAAGRETWVLLNFFATWCGPCMHEMPALEALSRAGQCLEVVGVATGQSEHPGGVATLQGVTFPLLWDNDGAVGNTWSVHRFPTTYLIDPHGYVQAVAVGGRAWEQMSQAVPTLPGCNSNKRRAR